MMPPDDTALTDVKRFLGGSPQAAIGELAVARGLMTRDQLEECLAEEELARAGGRPAQLVQILVRRRCITATQLVELLQAQKCAVCACPSCGWTCDASAHPAGVQLLCLECGALMRDAGGARAAAGEGRTLGKYRIVREIARGGMGVVYEAEDPALRRRVALKVIREEGAGAEAVPRLQREAAIAAQLQHPNIVAVHEVGVAPGTSGQPVHFIAMDYVEGRTLADLLREGKTPRGELLRILEDIARAVAFAGSRRVVHRDLKPANVLVDRSGRAVLTDFGVARAESFATRLTQSGTVMGTPHYMPPEQVEGRATDDPRLDVYALGAILYEILTGHPPFDGRTLQEVYRRILMEEPAAPGAETDLDTICLKALEKDTARRYASAEEFADDLERFRRGEPTVARPVGVVTRLARKAARRKAAVAAAFALVALGGAALGFAARAREQRAAALRQLDERVDVALRAALDFRRDGNLEKMRTFLADVERACAEGRSLLPDRPEPDALQGRMHRALMQYDRALEAQERALAKDANHAPALYERVVLTSRLHRRRVDELVARAWRERGELMHTSASGMRGGGGLEIPSRDALAREDAAATAHRRRIEADLLRLGDGVGEGELACARGLRAWMTGDVAEARALLETAIEKAPLLEEAYEALAAIEVESERFGEAIAVCTRGAQRDKGYLPHVESRGYARGQWAVRRWSDGEDGTPLLKEALADFDSVLSMDARRHEAWRLRGLVQYAWGWSSIAAQDEAERQFAAAEQDLSRAIELNAASWEGWMWRGSVKSARAWLAVWRLAPPLPLLKGAQSDLSEAIRLNPDGDEAYVYRAVVRVPWALYAVLSKEDPKVHYDEGLRDMAEALRRNPGRGMTWLWRGVMHWLWGSFLLSRGDDATAAFADSVADLDEATRLLRQGVALVWRAAANVRLGESRAERGEDPTAMYRAAVQDADRRLTEAKSERMWAKGARAEARLRWGVWEEDGGGDGSSHYAAALADYDEVCAKSPAVQSLTGRGELHVRMAERAERTGADASEPCRRAIADARAALQLSLLSVESLLIQGRAKTLLGQHAEALRDLDWFLAARPKATLGWRWRADAHRRAGDLKAAERDAAKAKALARKSR